MVFIGVSLIMSDEKHLFICKTAICTRVCQLSVYVFCYFFPIVFLKPCSFYYSIANSYFTFFASLTGKGTEVLCARCSS